MEKDAREVGRPAIMSRINYLIGAALVVCCFVGGLYLLKCFKSSHLDLSQDYYPSLTLEEKASYSSYDWASTEKVRIDLKGRRSGMVTIRALNREILFRTFIEDGIPEEIHMRIPTDLEMILVEYQGNSEQVALNSQRLALNL